MKFKKEIKVSREQLVSVACNNCGLSQAYGENGFPKDGLEFHSFWTGGGFYSVFPGDMNTIDFDLCDACLKEWVQGFRHPATWNGGAQARTRLDGSSFESVESPEEPE